VESGEGEGEVVDPGGNHFQRLRLHAEHLGQWRYCQPPLLAETDHPQTALPHQGAADGRQRVGQIEDDRPRAERGDVVPDLHRRRNHPQTAGEASRTHRLRGGLVDAVLLGDGHVPLACPGLAHRDGEQNVVAAGEKLTPIHAGLDVKPGAGGLHHPGGDALGQAQRLGVGVYQGDGGAGQSRPPHQVRDDVEGECRAGTDDG